AWELSVNRKLQQVHHNIIVSTLNKVDSGQKSESDGFEDDLFSSSSDDDKENQDKKTFQKGQNNLQSCEPTEYVDEVDQCI
ncbi:unnamed protein product, partial [Rotaria sp. Silwood1]